MGKRCTAEERREVLKRAEEIGALAGDQRGYACGWRSWERNELPSWRPPSVDGTNLCHAEEGEILPNGHREAEPRHYEKCSVSADPLLNLRRIPSVIGGLLPMTDRERYLHAVL